MVATIPIVDFSPFVRTSSSEQRLETAQALVQACRQVGFVYVKNHGLPQEILDQAFAMSKTFFDLTTAEKMKAPHPESWEIYRGYSWPGLEKVSNALSNMDDKEAIAQLREVQDYKESFDIGSEDNNEQPNIWLPGNILPEMRPFMNTFYTVCFTTARRILQALALGMGLADEDLLLKPHTGHHNQLRLLHYPPVPAEAIVGGKFARMPAHSDWSTMTMLFQDDCGGLQVESPDTAGEFIDATPVHGTLVLNVGDLLMRWSDDYLKSTQHRVALPPLQDRFMGEEKLTRARYSVPYFVSPEPDTLIESLCLDENRVPKYTPITQRAYNAMRAKMHY